MAPILAHPGPPRPLQVEKSARPAWSDGAGPTVMRASATVDPPARTRRDDDGSEE